jgi:hypothetical protein
VCMCVCVCALFKQETLFEVVEMEGGKRVEEVRIPQIWLLAVAL